MVRHDRPTSFVSAQVSVYPLRRRSISDTLEGVLRAFRTRRVGVSPGSMSTVITGEEADVFDAVRSGFQAACAEGDVVMVITLSNSCPTGQRRCRRPRRTPAPGSACTGP